MDKAKQAVSSFLSQDGKHKTTVDEEVRKPVIDEHVRPKQHEDVVTAVDREVHQDHHQTLVQPLHDQQILPEKHVHNAMPVEHRSFEHGNKANVERALQNDAAKYKNTSTTHDTHHSTTTNPVVAGERTHHHVHHHIQPVVHKETIAPEVVHTTAPIHETHHNAAIHHESTALPAMSLDEYTASRGTLNPQSTPRKFKEYDGCPTLQDKSLRQDARGKEALHGHNLAKEAVAGQKTK